MSIEETKLAALNFGLEPNWLEDFIARFGERALPILIEALRSGWSKETVVEVLTKLGIAVLELLVEALNRVRMLRGVASPGTEEEILSAGFIDTIIEKWLPVIIEKYGKEIIEKYLPLLLEKYAPMIVEFIVNLLLKSLKPDEAPVPPTPPAPPPPPPVEPGPVIS